MTPEAGVEAEILPVKDENDNLEVTNGTPLPPTEIRPEPQIETQELAPAQEKPIESEIQAPVVEISDYEDDEASDESVEADDKIFCEFTKIQRTRVKYKCEFKNAIVHIKGRDFVLKTMTGDIEY